MHLNAVLTAVILLSHADRVRADNRRNFNLLKNCGGTIELDDQYSGAVELGHTAAASSPCMVQLKTKSPNYIHLVTKEIETPCDTASILIQGEGNVMLNSSADCVNSLHTGSLDLTTGEGYRQLDVSLTFKNALSLNGVRSSFEYYVGNSLSPAAPAPVQANWQEICNGCDSKATCDYNFRTGSAKCNCNAGFTGNGTTCAEISPCDPNPCTVADCETVVRDYKCLCTSGYQWSPRKKDCEDIDECSNQTSCSGGSTCRNTRGSFDCICPQGTYYNGTSCNDIDECSGVNQCSNEANCVNTLGSYTCSCNPGFDGNGYLCQDKNECLDRTVCAENAICNNTLGSYSCRCKDNFAGDGKISCHEDATQPCAPSSNIWCSRNSGCVFNRITFKLGCECSKGYEGDGIHCKDVDECAIKTDNCAKQDKICLNRVGSFECRDKNSYCAKSAEIGKDECWCKPGYEGDYTSCKDSDECAIGNHSCHRLADCSNTDGSYSCTCTQGYTGSGKECIDINECVEKTDNCAQLGKICHNIVGSFECRHPKSTCSYSILERRVVCQCIAGYTGRYTNCTDINECDNNPCSDSISCTNVEGSYECTCKDGFIRAADKIQCNDVNECSDLSACPGGSTCINQRGGFTCSCPRGFRYIKESFTCQNINECVEGTHKCSPDAKCTDTEGSFTCTCKQGFRGNGFTCQDVDECLTKPCHADAICSPTAEGAYKCTCKDGYSGDGILICEDGAKKCGTSLYCSPHANCGYQFPDGFFCSCKEGFRPQGINGQICRDINECDSSPCIKAKNCTNSVGSFECVCKDGFQHTDSKKQICRDINECTLGTDSCHDDAECTNTVGSYNCSCNTGYSGNGTQCQAVRIATTTRLTTTTTASTTIPIDSTTRPIRIFGSRNHLSFTWSVTYDLLKYVSIVNETIHSRLKLVKDRYQNDYPLLPVIVQLTNSTYDLSKGYLWMAYDVQYFEPDSRTNAQPRSFYADDRNFGKRIFKPVERIYDQGTHLTGDLKDSELLSYRGTETIVAEREEIFEVGISEPLQ